MKTPFTNEQFFAVFQNYNSSVFPAQIILLALGLFALYLLRTSRNSKNEIIGVLLGLFWIWTGVAYHVMFFSSINPVAFAFGIIFIMQGILFFLETYKRDKIKFVNKKGIEESFAIGLILIGLLFYPLPSYFLEGTLSKVISFGLPCPTVITTFGFLMLADKTVSKYLLIIPSLWAVLVIPVALNFGIYQDFLLIISAVTANVYLFRGRRKLVSAVGE